MSSPPVESRESSGGIEQLFSGGRFILVLWFGLAVSLLGDHFYRVGLTWGVTSGADGAAQGAWLGAAMTVPIAVLGMVAGAVVDRYDKLSLMIVTDVIRFAVVGVLGMSYLLGSPSLPFVLAGAADRKSVV